MTPTEIRTAVRTLRAQGHSLREIGRVLALSRNTVRRILRAPGGEVAETPPCDEATLGRLKAAFARTLGFRFRAHRVGNPDRKGRIERPFAYVETNFLAGRGFADFDDLNRQAVDWCRTVANHKPKQALGMSPEAACLVERPHLVPLPEALPPVYELLERVVDLHGYVSVDTNRYSVPERYVGKSVAVYKLPAEVHVRRKDSTIAIHRRLIDERDAKSTLAGHHTIPLRQGRGHAFPLYEHTQRPRHGGRGSIAGRPSSEPRPLHSRSQAAWQCRQQASPAPADRDEAHLPGRSVHRRHRTGSAIRLVRPRTPGRPHPQTGRRLLLRAGHQGGRRCMTSCAR